MISSRTRTKPFRMTGDDSTRLNPGQQEQSTDDWEAEFFQRVETEWKNFGGQDCPTFSRLEGEFFSTPVTAIPTTTTPVTAIPTTTTPVTAMPTTTFTISRRIAPFSIHMDESDEIHAEENKDKIVLDDDDGNAARRQGIQEWACRVDEGALFQCAIQLVGCERLAECAASFDNSSSSSSMPPATDSSSRNRLNGISQGKLSPFLFVLLACTSNATCFACLKALSEDTFVHPHTRKRIPEHKQQWNLRMMFSRPHGLSVLHLLVLAHERFQHTHRDWQECLAFLLESSTSSSLSDLLTMTSHAIGRDNVCRNALETCIYFSDAPVFSRMLDCLFEQHKTYSFDENDIARIWDLLKPCISYDKSCVVNRGKDDEKFSRDESPSSTIPTKEYSATFPFWRINMQILDAQTQYALALSNQQVKQSPLVSDASVVHMHVILARLCAHLVANKTMDVMLLECVRQMTEKDSQPRHQSFFVLLFRVLLLLVEEYHAVIPSRVKQQVLRALVFYTTCTKNRIAWELLEFYYTKHLDLETFGLFSIACLSEWPKTRPVFQSFLSYVASLGNPAIADDLFSFLLQHHLETLIQHPSAFHVLDQHVCPLPSPQIVFFILETKKVAGLDLLLSTWGASLFCRVLSAANGHCLQEFFHRRWLSGIHFLLTALPTPCRISPAIWKQVFAHLLSKSTNDQVLFDGMCLVSLYEASVYAWLEKDNMHEYGRLQQDSARIAAIANLHKMKHWAAEMRVDTVLCELAKKQVLEMLEEEIKQSHAAIVFSILSL